MSDARIQEARRSAALGDPGAEARLIVERMRAGSLTREWVELAAYCGHAAARAALPPASCADVYDAVTLHDSDALVFATWVQGLSRWGLEVRRRATVAGPRAAFVASAGATTEWFAMAAADKFVADPTPANHQALCYAVHPGDAILTPPWVPCGCALHDATSTVHIERAAAFVGEQPVREAIQSALVRYALGE